MLKQKAVDAISKKTLFAVVTVTVFSSIYLHSLRQTHYFHISNYR